VRIRPATDADRLALAQLYAAVAAEGDKIGGEAPVDVERRAETFRLEGFFVADAEGEIIGSISVFEGPAGVGEIGMMVARAWRRRGVGMRLMEEAIDYARSQGMHKLSLGVWPHNEAAIGLYRKLGFVEEGRRVKHYRRRNGELWDIVEMGLLLDAVALP
jgi:RimJ/RimL family protein N-acetyltransferase